MFQFINQVYISIYSGHFLFFISVSHFHHSDSTYILLDFLDFSGCCNQTPWTGWLINNTNLFLTVVGAGKSTIKAPVWSKCGDGQHLFTGQWGTKFSGAFVCLFVCIYIWISSPSSSPPPLLPLFFRPD